MSLFEYVVLSSGISFISSTLLLLFSLGYKLDNEPKKSNRCITYCIICFVYSFIIMCIDIYYL